MKNITKLTAIIILLAIVFPTIPVSAMTSAEPFESTENEIVKLFNKARTVAGMTELEQDENLTKLARIKAQEMADKHLNKPEFPEGIKKFLKDNGAEAKSNPYFYSAGKKTPAEIVEEWTKHINFKRDTRSDDKTTQIGVGAAKDSDGMMYVVCLNVQPFGDSEKAVLEDEVIRLVNDERAKYGFAPVVKSDDLTEVSRMKATDMADNEYCTHKSPVYGSPGDMVSKYTENIAFIGENIAAGQQTTQDVFTAWLNSPAHKAVMLSKSADCIGVGVDIDSKNNLTWSLIVGTN